MPNLYFLRCRLPSPGDGIFYVGEYLLANEGFMDDLPLAV